MTPTNREEKVYLAVAQGWFEIRPDGSVWRIAQRHKSGWTGNVRISPVTPRRIDASVGAGYRTVKVMIDGKQTCALAHRLVWLHLHGPIPPGLTINHKNGDKADNRPENLELATYAEQALHAVHVLGRGHTLKQNGEANLSHKLTEAQMREIRRRRKAGEKLTVIAEAFGISQQAVSKIARRERWGWAT